MVRPTDLFSVVSNGVSLDRAVVVALQQQLQASQRVSFDGLATRLHWPFIHNC